MAKEFPTGVEFPAYMAQHAAYKLDGASPPDMTLDELFVGVEHEGLRSQIRADGVASFTGPSGQEHHVMVDVAADGRVMAVAAAIPRTPGRADEFLRQVADFSTDTNLGRKEQIDLYNRVYETEGLVNNATNKCSSLVATQGSFKVRRVAGKPGRSGDSRAQELSILLQYWMENVNGNDLDAVVTGAQGLQDFIVQGVRQALIEGDHVARANWSKIKVPQLANKAFSLPMNLQSFPGEEIEIPDETAGTSLEAIYWVPSTKLLDVIKGQGKDKEIKKLIDKLIPKDVQSALKKDGRYLLMPNLMLHIKHRGIQKKPYGESFVRAAMSSVAYKRALFALELVTIENLVNRMLIFKIGSDDPLSKYHALEVSQVRALRLEALLRRIGPSSTVIWAGPDLEAVDVGAHGKILDLDARLQLVRSMIRDDLGVPAALLTGEGADGKASGNAATKGVGAQLLELQNRYKQAMVTLARRIAEVNNFGDVDVTFEFTQNILTDKSETVAALQKGYASGNVSTRTMITDGYGLDYEAEESRQQDDVDKGYKDELFGPPKAVMTLNTSGLMNGGGVDGRPVQEPGTKDVRKDKETGDAVENK